MMRVVHDEPKTYGRISLQFGLSGDRDRYDARYSTHQFLPDLLTIEYRMNRTGEWFEDAWTLYGPRVLTSGRTSKKIRLKLDGYFVGTRSTVEIPDWVQEVAEKYRPAKTFVAPNATSDLTLIY